MAKYITRQRSLLLDYLSRHADESLSARQISLALEDDGVSVSAVYRNLTELENEGQVRRVSGGGREAYYQYSAAAACRGCLHLLCRSCGHTYHMDMRDARQLADSLEKKEGFALDMAGTVLYGICGACRSA
ncbi:MAG: transcriptional repressor [Clostridia bacterium]|nr:transcriptional repressor [Clostridia bacterium]